MVPENLAQADKADQAIVVAGADGEVEAPALLARLGVLAGELRADLRNRQRPTWSARHLMGEASVVVPLRDDRGIGFGLDCREVDAFAFEELSRKHGLILECQCQSCSTSNWRGSGAAELLVRRAGRVVPP